MRPRPLRCPHRTRTDFSHLLRTPLLCGFGDDALARILIVGNVDRMETRDTVMSGSNSFNVGGWTVAPDLGEISRGTETVALRRQVMDLLVHLAGKEGEVAGIDELLEHLWAGKYVTEGTLYNCVGELRQALGDDQEYVKTVSTLR